MNEEEQYLIDDLADTDWEISDEVMFDYIDTLKAE